MKIVVTLLQAILCGAGCFGMSAKNDNVHFEQFVHNIELLTRFANGIALQSQIYNDFTNTTAYYLKFDKKQFRTIRRLPTGQIYETIKSLYEKSQEIEFDPKMKQVNEGLKWMEPMMKITGKLEDSLNKEKIDSYIDTIETFKNHSLIFKKLRFTNYRSILKCFIKDNSLSLNRVMECFEIFKAGKLTLAGLKTNIKYLVTNPEAIQIFNDSERVVERFDSADLLAATVNLLELFSNVNTSVIRIRNVMKRISEQFDKSNTLLKGLFKQKHLKVSEAADKFDLIGLDHPDSLTLQQESLDKMFPNTEDIEKMYSNLETEWMRNLIEVSAGKNGTKKVKRALDPLVQYTHKVIQISKIKKKLFGTNWTSTIKRMLPLFQKINELEKWWDNGRVDGQFAVPSDLFEPFLKCVTELPQLSTSVDKPKVMKLLNETIQINTQVKEVLYIADFFRQSWFLSFVENQYIAVDQFLNETLSDEKNIDNIKGKMEKMQQHFLNTESRELIKKVNDFIGSDMNDIDGIFESGFLENLSKHSDISVFSKTVEQIRGDHLFSLMNCYLKQQKSFKTLSKIIKGACEFQEFSKQTGIAWLLSYLNDFSQVQKLLNDTEEFINSWRTDGVLSPESKKMIELGIGHDVAGRFWSSLISLEMINSHFKKQEFFENLVRIEVNEKHGEFARRWSKSYRNGIIRLIKDMKKMKDAIRKYEDEEHGLKGVFEMFSEASKIRGVPIQWRGVDALNITLIQKFRELANRNDLDFSSHSAHFNSAASEVTTLREFLESLKDPILLVFNFPISTVILTIGALLISIFLLLVVGFFLTSNGRKRWRKFYLTRWGSNEDLEQCWRYSFWTDQISNKNMLCEAVREINYEHVKALVEKGAYINPYNSFGNTPLHASTKYGHVKIVEILLMNGADRGAYNTNNRTPEQMNEMVSKNVTTSRLNTSNEPTDRRKPSMVEDIERLYRKYDNKTFKPRIPDLLPIMAYHVKIDSKITNSKVDAFTVKFKGMVTDQMSGVTHLVVPTSSFGVLITDDFNYIMCVFLPTILMQEQWLGACLDNKSNLRDDYKWRVQNVEYMGKIYKTVVKWARWVHKQSIPYLFGVQFYMTDDAHSDASVGNQLKPLVEMHGATLCDEVPVKENYNQGSHPFHHFHRGPLFIIHSHMDNQFEHLRNDSMFTLMTIHQFIVFMLEMHVKYDPERKPPIPVYNEDFTILNATSSRM